ncbi:ABC transporter substrate-binding protein [Roseococcus microcysteis]|uniref:ABC transporter substrate-binding protein n=1 Tax=Roseococcus microcysteis TaxID=2771361 RepID=UPI00168A4833|nr:extracellular solute-binding protein [Roseococcus microcysteis]
MTLLPRRALGALLATPWVAPAAAQPRSSVHFLSWTAVLDSLRAQFAEFTRASGVTVRHQHVPWISYRPALLAQLRATAAADVVLMSDAWLPEVAASGLLAPIDAMPALTRFNAEAAPACTEAMRFGGQQYGLAYYTDSIGFFYHRGLLQAAGIVTPPTSWEEVMDHCRRIRSLGIARFPMGLPLAGDPWLIELLSTLVFSHGGRFVDDARVSVMAEPGRGIIPTLAFLRDMIHRHQALDPTSPGQDEVGVARAFAEGRHAFALLPSYRLRSLNNPLTSDVAGQARLGLMPVGGAQLDPATCGWVRFYAISAAAGRDAGRLARASAFLSAFGGHDASGAYTMQRRLFVNDGLPFCTLPLLNDPRVSDVLVSDGESPEWRALHLASARNKDVIAPWFGNWQGVTNEIWRAVALDRLAPEAAAEMAHALWVQLCDACRLRP